jgi:hypothetical protein
MNSYLDARLNLSLTLILRRETDASNNSLIALEASLSLSDKDCYKFSQS